jgi:hypothetical protein
MPAVMTYRPRPAFIFSLTILAALAFGATSRSAHAQGNGVASYWEGSSPRVYAFTSEMSGRLHANWWDGSSWHWADHGFPLGATVNSAPAEITYREAGVDKLYVFVTGSNGHLYVRWWDGLHWRWDDQGLPEAAKAVCSPAVVTFSDRGTQFIYVFITGNDGHLYVHWWNGARWSWADQGLPAPTIPSGSVRSVSTPAAITYMQGTTRLFYTFVIGDDGQAYANWWNGAQWNWAAQGAPTYTALISTPSVITSVENGVQQINMFVTGDDGHLYTDWWDGTRWQWSDQGNPLGTSFSTSPRACAATRNGTTLLNVFLIGQDQHLYTNWWDGRRWQWSDQGANAARLIGTTALERPDRMVLYALFTRTDNRLYADYWDGARWAIVDAQTPPAGFRLIPALNFLFADVSPDPPSAPSYGNSDSGGKAVSVVVSPVPSTTVAETVYVAAEYSGIWKSRDSGTTWQQASRGLTTGRSSSWNHGLALDEEAPERLLYATLDDDYRTGDGRTGGARTGGLWLTLDGAERWRHVDLPDCLDPNILAVAFGAGRGYVLSGRCNAVFTSRDLATWETLPWPPSGAPAPGILAVHKQSVFTCSGSVAYRGIYGSSGFRWDASVNLPTPCDGITPLPTAASVSPAALVLYNTGTGRAEIALVNFDTRATPMPLNFAAAQLALHGADGVDCCGVNGVFVARRAGTTPERFDVIFGNQLQFFELTSGLTVNMVFTPTNWIRPSFVDSRDARLIHDDTWAAAFSPSYDGVTRCGAYIVTDGGISKRQNCNSYSWTTANTGFHAFKSQYIAGIARGFCRRAGGFSHPCASLYVPSGDNGTWFSIPGGLPVGPASSFVWSNLSGGDSGFASVDRAVPGLMNSDRMAWKSGDGMPPDQYSTAFQLYSNADQADYIGQYPDNNQWPPRSPLHQILTLPGEAPPPAGDYLSISRPAGSNRDTIKRAVPEILSLSPVGISVTWQDISPSASFAGSTLFALASSGGHRSPVIYVLRKFGPTRDDQAQVLRGTVNASTGLVSSWENRSNISSVCPSNSVALENPLNIAVHPYLPDVVYVADAGTRQIKFSTNAGQCWFVETELTEMATNHGEFRFECAGGIANGNRFCPLQQMLFATDDGRVRIAILFPGGVAMTQNWGAPWVSISDRLVSQAGAPDIRRLSDLVAYPMSGFFDANGVRALGRPVGGSLYLGLLGRGLVRIDISRP